METERRDHEKDTPERPDFHGIVERRRREALANAPKCEHHPDRPGVHLVTVPDEESGGQRRVSVCEECKGNAVAAQVQADRRKLMETRAATVDGVVAERCGRKYVGKRLKDLVGYSRAFLTALAGLGDPPASAIFTGPPGNGKTHAAVALYSHLWAEGYEVSFYVAGDLMDLIRKEARTEATLEALVTGMRGWGVLIVDDLGGDRLTEVTAEGLRRILDWRDRDGSTTIITTNLEEEGLRDYLGDPAVSRILGMAGGNVFNFDGPDRRDPQNDG